MSELCSEDYHLRFRHLRLKPGEQRTILAHTTLFFLTDPPTDARVESDIGLFDESELGASELQYEHKGTILVTNYSIFSNHVRFIQVIPKR
ncbi:hypothetical protein [Dinghuibacter silviterrae]|nr:hypothetical protein [Dinghuibacter silviterrae]